MLNFLTDIHSDIVCLQETWLNKHDKSILAEIKNDYNFEIGTESIQAYQDQWRRIACLIQIEHEGKENLAEGSYQIYYF